MSYLGEEIPKLGFGLMRLPHFEDGKPDIEQVKQMVDAFMDAGLTYFDTARAYGDSENVIHDALVARYPRESFQLATKNAAWLQAKNEQEAKDFFRQSLEATGAGYFDFYLLHNLGQARTKVFDDYDMWTFAKELKAQGKVKHIGISFHDVAAELDPILSAHPEIEFVQLQINYADWNGKNVQSRRCYEVARSYGKPVIIMEPVKGGQLANPPQAVADILKSADADASIVSWALRFAWDLEGLITVLSGMSTIDQMRENIQLYQSRKPLSSIELDAIHAAQAKLDELIAVACTACKYCMKECPQNINIAGIMECLNRAALFGADVGKREYRFQTMGYGKASDCIHCGQCEGACPQRIEIMAELEKATGLFE